MRRILIIFILLLAFSSASYGAVSQDIYVRKDVFEVEMKNLNSNMEKILTKLDTLDRNMNELTKTVAVLAERIEGVNTSLSQKIESVNKSLSERIESVNTSLSQKIESVNKSLSERIESVNTSLSQKIEGVNNSLSERIESVNTSLSQKIESVNNSLSERIDGINNSLSRRTDGLEKRIEDNNTFLYYILVLFGAMLVMPFFNRWWEANKEKSKTQIVTLEDVKRLIAEAQISSRSQV